MTPVWSFCCMIRNIHPSNKYGELVDPILGATLHNDPIFKKNKKVLVFRLLSPGNARESLQSPQPVSWVDSKTENVVLEERRYKRTVKGHVFNSYRSTNRDKLCGGILAEEKGVFYLKIT